MTRKPTATIALLFITSAIFPLDPRVAHGNGANQSTSASDHQAATDDPLVIGDEGIRVRFVSNAQHEFEVFFEARAEDHWVGVAQFPSGRPWIVYSDWKDSWFTAPHTIGVQQVERMDDGRVRTSATASVDGQSWCFSDVYSLEAGLIKIERTFEHLSDARQEKITLATRVRVAWGSAPRILVPGSLYNGNPSSTLPGPTLSYQPDSMGLYEEHRLPVPMVNMESTVGGRRVHGTLVTDPGKIAQGRKGNDHWWSLGLEFGDGYVDLMSVSGPVATNGKKSTLYGHRNGFDRYDEAYLEITGPQQFKKTFYLDFGLDQKVGYAFRPGLWKAFQLFQPVDVPHVDFSEAMALKVQYAKGTFYSKAPDVAGFRAWPAPNRHFQYGWCGGNIAVAYGLLSHAQQTGDQQSLQQAIDAISFYAKHSEQDVPGMLYGDYFAAPTPSSPFGVHSEGDGWQPTQFHGVEPAISSRQLGETLERMAEAIVLARKMKIGGPADAWQATLRRGCDFLARSPRSQGMFPRAWNRDGTARGWDGDRPRDPRWLSAAGAYCVGPLVRIWQLSGEEEYLNLAEEVLVGYWSEFGEDQSRPPWGGTHDAGAEDKEAGWGLMKAALDVYEATKNPKYLEWAQLAADWTLTWMYFHDIGMPESDLLRDHLHTVGWTFISTQNQEIDVFGFWMAPDYYRLGQLLDDNRYKQIGKVLFDAATQTIARKEAMFGQTAAGIQAEHYNHSNCTYVHGGQWRGSQYSVGIGWVLGSTLYGGAKLAELDPKQFAWTGGENRQTEAASSSRPVAPSYAVVRRPIVVDGNTDDWEGVKSNRVAGAGHLWFGQGMTPDRWRGDDDHSYGWRAAWSNNKLYFLFEVTDDHLIDPPNQPNSYLNDCIEILLDHKNRGGQRFVEDGDTKRLRGFEMHFLPTSPPLVFLDDSLSPRYPVTSPQNELFEKKWAGEAHVRKTETGYIMEIGFSVPGVTLQVGTELGVDTSVCDDDGDGRKSLQIWTGKQVDFWITMDHYGKLRIVD